MEIRNRLKEWFDSIEGEENRRQHLRAFGDFCLDLLEEEYGRIVPRGEIDPQFVKGLAHPHLKKIRHLMTKYSPQDGEIYKPKL